MRFNWVRTALIFTVFYVFFLVLPSYLPSILGSDVLASVKVLDSPATVSPSQVYTETVQVCDTGASGNVQITASVDYDGSASPGLILVSVPAGGCTNQTFTITAPSSGCFNNQFSVIYDASSFGFATQTRQLLSEVGLTVHNNNPFSVDVTIVGTSWGGATGQNFQISANSVSGPTNIWSVNCSTNPNVTVTVSVTRVSDGLFLGNFTSPLTAVQNGCRFQIQINVNPPVPPTPTPLPSSSPVPTPSPVVTPTPGPGPEICGNGIDDNGNGLIDEPPCPQNPITVVLFANGVPGTLTIPAAGNVTLSWTTSGNPISCIASNGWGGSKNPSGGSESVFVGSNTTYTIECLALDSSIPHAFSSVTVNIGVVSASPSPTPTPSEICGNGIDDNGNGLIDENCVVTSGQVSYLIKCDPLGNETVDIFYPPYDPAQYTSHTVLLKTGSTAAGPWSLVQTWDKSTEFGHLNVPIFYPNFYRIEAIRQYLGSFGGSLFYDDVRFRAINCALMQPSPTPVPVPTPTPSPGPPVEICGNGIDDNGDGFIDEGCPLPPPPVQPGTNTTVQFCKAYGDIVGLVSYFSFNGPVPPGGLNYMQISEGSVGNLKATINPWPASLVKVSGPGFFISGVTYYFRGYYLGAGGFPNLIDSTAYVITPDYATMPTCPGLPVAGTPVDLEVVAVGMTDPATGTPKTDFLPGESARASFTVRNPSTSSVFTSVGFWPTGHVSSYGSGAVPSCPTLTGVPASGLGVDSVSLSFPPGDTTITFNFTVANTLDIYFAHAYVSYSCLPDEGPVIGNTPWGNNEAVITYRVGGGDPWLETRGGDVGAFSSITIGGVAVAPAFTSEYLLAGTSLGANATTKNWKLNNYNKPQVSQDVYTYINGKFGNRATLNTCDIASLTPTTPGSGFNHCAGDVSLSGTITGGNNYVWFIDGNLNITGSFTVPADSTMVFVVKGNVVVNTGALRADGIYIVKGTFTDVDVSGNTSQILIVDGAIYASGDINLPRTLSGSNNTILPADVVTFQPKYVQALNGLLGTASITWQEVAP